MKELARFAFAVLTLGLAACATSSAHRTAPITVQSVTISPRVEEIKPTFQRSYENRPPLAAPVGDILRREFFTVLRRNHYFAEVTGAVPVTPRDSELDLQQLKTTPRTTAGLSGGIFHLTVRDWGFSRVGLSVKRQPLISIEAVLTDRRGQELARAQATAAHAELPQQPAATYLGRPDVAAIDLGIAAEAASQRLLEAMLAPQSSPAARTDRR